MGHGEPLLPIGYDPETIEVSSYFVKDRKTGRVILSKNADGIYPAASTVKLITALVSRGSLKDGSMVRVTDRAARVEPTRANLRKGERYRYADLLQAMLIQSANDAALSVAAAIDGSEAAFVKRMNRWCADRGLSKTRAADVAGLSGSTVSSARDLARIVEIFMGTPGMMKILLRNTYAFRSDGGRLITVRNKNTFHRLRPAVYGRLIGKTGYTRTSGYCFAGIVIYGKRSYVLTIMGSSMAWHGINVLMNHVNQLYDSGRL